MPVRSGFSHGLAAFFGIVFASIISESVRMHNESLHSATVAVGSFVVDLFGLDMPESIVGIIVLAFVLAFGWGMVYHWGRFE